MFEVILGYIVNLRPIWDTNCSAPVILIKKGALKSHLQNLIVRKPVLVVFKVRN